MELKLLPCPFCGTVPTRFLDSKGPRGPNYEWIVCDNDDCAAEGPVKKTQELAAAAWNARANGDGDL